MIMNANNLDYNLIGKEFVHFKGGWCRPIEKPNYSGQRFWTDLYKK